jgi:methyl-accepting chemotaxis protein
VIAKELADNANNGLMALKQTVNGIEQIQKSSAEMAKVISALGKHAMDIGNILHVIDDVTKQTNLLALNAAIISAQAGEHGRGFAVVAEEIGALAGRTKDSTKEIAELINTIQNEARRAINVMNEGEATIAEGAKFGIEAAKAFDKLKDSADKSTIQAKALAKATTEQAEDVRAVTKAIENISTTVEEINTSAHHQSEEAAALNQAAGKMNLLNQQVARSSEEQARSAGEVLKAIQNISTMSNMVTECQAAQMKSTQEASKAVDSVDKNAISQNNAAVRLNNIIATINEQLKELLIFTEEFKI